jgi:vacuolar-type H+-ATPase subunit H
MPKKTKKEKIIAQYRRQLKFLQEKGIQILPKQAQIEKKETAVNKQKTAENLQLDSLDKTKHFFVIDLKKSIFLSLLIIALELFLYFALVLELKF